MSLTDIPAKKIWLFFGALVAFECLLAVLNVLQLPWWWLNRLIYLDGEQTIPAWFSSSQLLLLAVSCAAAWRDDRAAGVVRHSWLALTGLFGWLSLDEAVSIHETLGIAFARSQGIRLIGMPLWLVIFAPLILLGLIALVTAIGLRLRHLRVAMWLALGGTSLWILSLGFEAMPAYFQICRAPSLPIWSFRACMVCEEFCEMLGATLWWAAVTSWLRHVQSESEVS
jgi:hypothetical protein